MLRRVAGLSPRGYRLRYQASWYCIFDKVFFFFMAQQPLAGQGLLVVEASLPHSGTPQPVRLLWTSDQIDMHNTQHSQLTVIHAPGGFLTHNYSKPQDARPQRVALCADRSGTTKGISRNTSALSSAYAINFHTRITFLYHRRHNNKLSNWQRRYIKHSSIFLHLTACGKGSV